MPASALPLTTRTLELHARRAAVPGYDRTRLTQGIVHIGVGGFHRAHQAIYLDDLAQLGRCRKWGVTGISFQRRRMKTALAPQDHLYTVVEQGPLGDRARIIGALRACLFSAEEPHTVLRALCSPKTRLVTLTITGDGYGQPHGPAGGNSDVFAFLSAALDRRRRSGTAPFTVLSCDNLPDNGAMARRATLRAASSGGPRLVDWIADRVRFPDSVVDRITPETTSATRAYVARRFGIADRAPVVTEPFSQWVVQDAFCNERPPLDEVGVRYVRSVAGHALTKRRMLNGAHSALGYIGWLLGHRTTDRAMSDPDLARYMEMLLEDEIEALLEDSGVDVAGYRQSVLSRLRNPRLADQLGRLCARGSTKMPAYLLPSLAEACRAGRPHSLLALAVAAWMRYLVGVDLEGHPIEVADDRLEVLRPLVLRGGTDPRPLLSREDLFDGLAGHSGVADSIEAAACEIERQGLRRTLERRCSSCPEAIAA